MKLQSLNVRRGPLLVRGDSRNLGLADLVAIGVDVLSPFMVLIGLGGRPAGVSGTLITDSPDVDSKEKDAEEVAADSEPVSEEADVSSSDDWSGGSRQTDRQTDPKV